MSNKVTVSKAAFWTGWVMTVLPVGMFVMGAVTSFGKPPMVTEGMARMGFDERVIIPLAIVQLVCAILYLIPRTAVLGAILLTGYLGGAVCVHVRANESFHMAVIVGIVVWGGLFLRDPRVRDLIPLRR